MLIERVEQRVLGALQLVDRVTQTPVIRAIKITAERATLVRNRRGYYVITQADGLEAHGAAFETPPTTPALAANEYDFVIEDRQKRYLPRLLTLRLPRDPDPTHRDNSNSLFRPQDVAMYPASTAPLSHNWSTVRVAVDQVGSSPVRGALIRIIDPTEDTLLASGISDERGEALVIVPGVPVTKFADEGDGGHGHGSGHGGSHGHGGGEPPVLVNTLAVRLELSLTPGSPWPVDPDLLEQNHVAHRRASKDLTLSTGRMEKVVINLI